MNYLIEISYWFSVQLLRRKKIFLCIFKALEFRLSVVGLTPLLPPNAEDKN